jgi:hypothetical protein
MRIREEVLRHPAARTSISRFELIEFTGERYGTENMNDKLRDFRKKLTIAIDFLSNKKSVQNVSDYFPELVNYSDNIDPIIHQARLIDSLNPIERNDVTVISRSRVDELAETCEIGQDHVISLLAQFFVVQREPSSDSVTDFYADLNSFRAKIGREKPA